MARKKKTAKQKRQAKASRKISKLVREGVPQEEAVARGLRFAGIPKKKAKRKKK